jgi:hypothetical protein
MLRTAPGADGARLLGQLPEKLAKFVASEETRLRKYFHWAMNQLMVGRPLSGSRPLCPCAPSPPDGKTRFGPERSRQMTENKANYKIRNRLL